MNDVPSPVRPSTAGASGAAGAGAPVRFESYDDVPAACTLTGGSAVWRMPPREIGETLAISPRMKWFAMIAVVVATVIGVWLFDQAR